MKMPSVYSKRGILLFAAAIAFPVIAASCTKADATNGDTASATQESASSGEDAGREALALPVAVDEVRDGDLVLHVRTTGQVRSDAVVKLRNEVAGTVAEISAKPGQQVAKGQILVKLDPYPFELAVREAQAVTDESEQRYLESYVPESLITGVGPTPEQRRALMNRSGVTGARLKLERAKYELERATIRSPVDGVVDMVNVAVGEKLSGATDLLTVVDTRHLRIDAQVLEHDMPLIRVGGEATVSNAGEPGKIIHGRIDALLPLVDSTTRSGRAIVRITGDGTIRPGMYADVELEATRLRNRRLTPTRAIIERDGRPLVFVVRDGRAQWTYIVPGQSNGIYTEVLPDSTTGEIPVKPGDKVIVEGHLTLIHDARVRIGRDASVNPRKPE